MKQVQHIKDITAEVSAFEDLKGQGLFSFRVLVPEDMRADPGQFAMVSVPGHTLRRPLSIATYKKTGSNLGEAGGEYTFYVREVGKGTRDLLDHVSSNDTVNLSGPFGNGFPLKDNGHKWLLVGGGIGIAPLMGIANEPNTCRPVCIVGTNTIDEAKIWYSQLEWFDLSSENVFYSIMDIGKQDSFDPLIKSPVFHGNAAESLKDYLAKNPKENFDAAFVCGPKKMMLAVAEILERAQIPAYVSLEERMACAVGSCCSCAIPGTNNGHGVPFHVCKDGPVFPAKILENYRSSK